MTDLLSGAADPTMLLDPSGAQHCTPLLVQYTEGSTHQGVIPIGCMLRPQPEYPFTACLLTPFVSLSGLLFEGLDLCLVSDSSSAGWHHAHTTTQVSMTFGRTRFG